MSIFESLLKIGAGLDWLGPVIAILQNYRNRPSVSYAVPLQVGGIVDILQEQGIKVWGIIAVDNDLLFSVRLAQARYTQYILERHGVVYTGGIEIQEAYSKKQSNNNQEEKGWFDRTITSIDKFVNSI